MQMPAELFCSVTVKRYAPGALDANGRFTAGAESTVTITASVYPAGMKTMLSPEEGERTKDQIGIVTQDPIYTLDETLGRKADRVLWDGEYYQVRQVQHFTNTPELTHYNATAVREQKA